MKPRGFQNYFRRLPKSRSGTSPRAKIYLRGAQDQPRGAQERPRSAKEAPKAAQETPKSGREIPSSFKIEPGRVRNLSQTCSGAFRKYVADQSSKEAFSETSANEFSSFFFDDREQQEP